jgi:prophage maintenance system killer protein
MIKNHPFENGNKRIAITTLLTFLFANNKWLVADIQEIYNSTVWIAQSPAQFKDEVVKAIGKFLKRHVKDV